jgi:predicted PurR-regulated permease PerM
MMASTQRTAQTVVVILLTAMAVLVAAYLVYRLSTVIEWLILSIFLAVALEPAVGVLRKRGVRRIPAILIVFLLVFVTIALVVALALPALVQQFKSIITALQTPGGLTEQVQRLATPLGLSGLVQTFRGQIESLPGQLASVVGPLTTVTANTVGAVAATGTVIVLTFFMVNDGERLVTGFVGLLPQRMQPRMRRVLDQSARAVSGYITGNLAISAIAGAGVFVGMTLLGIPYALALAALLAICDLIPLVGATLGAIAPILAAFGISPLKALVLLVYIILYQQFESHVLNPLVYGRSVHLPGLVVFLAVLVGGVLMGILGALIAIPVAEIIRLVLIELRGGPPERSFQAAVPRATVHVEAV